MEILTSYQALTISSSVQVKIPNFPFGDQRGYTDSSGVYLRKRTDDEEVRAGMDVQVCVDEQCASGAKNKEEERGNWSHMSENVNHVQIHEVSRL